MLAFDDCPGRVDAARSRSAWLNLAARRSRDPAMTLPSSGTSEGALRSEDTQLATTGFRSQHGRALVSP
jgi:hypothetical protein